MERSECEIMDMGIFFNSIIGVWGVCVFTCMYTFKEVFSKTIAVKGFI